MNQTNGSDGTPPPAVLVPVRVADRVELATRLLRQHTDAGWSAIEDRILRQALTAFRPSAPVRGRHAAGDFFVTADVVAHRLRQAVDAVPLAAAERITCTTDERDELDVVTIQLVAAYGAPLVDLARRVHATASRALTDLLGTLAPPGADIHAHVHIGDVSDDPRTVS